MSGLKQTAASIAEGGEQQIEQSFGGHARMQVILLLAGVLALDAADKATVSAVAGSLKDAFSIGNTEIGILVAATSFVGAIFTLPIGILVDRTQRNRILLIAISIWTVAMVVSGTATSFIYMLITRIALGAVTAAAAPTIASLTGDYFPGNERANIYGMILAGELVGTGIGYFFAGEISSWIGWRWPFYLMAVPSAALIWAIWRWLPEPARGGQSWIAVGQEHVVSEEEAREDGGTGSDGEPRGKQREQAANKPDGSQGESRGGQLSHEAVRQSGIRPREELVLHDNPSKRSLWWALRYLLQLPTYILLIIASALVYYFFAGVRAFGMIYLTQHYGVSRATLSALVIVVGLGALAGVLLGGRFSEWLLNRRWLNARIGIPGVALLVSVLLFAPAIWTTSPYIGIALLTFGAGALAAANPSIDAARLDIIPPRLWGRAEAGRTSLRAALEGGAPILFGWISNLLGGGDSGLKWTYLIMLVPVLIASGLAIPARKTYLRDVATASASAENSSRQKDQTHARGPN